MCFCLSRQAGFATAAVCRKVSCKKPQERPRRRLTGSAFGDKIVAHATFLMKGCDNMHPFMRQISITYRCAMRFRERELADAGLAGCQTPYLTALYRRPGISQEEMARTLNVNKSSVTRQLSILEEKGYIRREPAPADKRLSLVYPTEKAMQVKEAIFHCYHAWSRYLTQDFTDEEQAMLSSLMARIAVRAEEYVKGGEPSCEYSENT